ncbi:hypothetical protein [Amycolatopsis vastitatis]|uniref:hypothetical protein n=1 Tax=Amycolatopsis vastitatis TaxID=1905142 RepID=UPI00196B430B|nr:hypothetical protein [Amycolatopsis vastitatis]
MPTSHSTPTYRTVSVLAEVLAERARQDGRQDHPDGTGPERDNPVRLASNISEATDAARQATDRALSRGEVTFAQILTEEAFEALAETDPARLRAELVQVAASAVCWIEAVDRRAPGPRTAGFVPGEVVRNRRTSELLTVTGDPATWDPYYYEPADTAAGEEIASPERT